MNRPGPGDKATAGNAPGIRCPACCHYYITHDKAFPYGCRAMGFKSRSTPSLAVFSSSGMECQMFRKKERPRRS